LNFDLPDIPVKPKMFKFDFDPSQNSTYKFSSIEYMGSNHLNTDIDLGMNIDLVHRNMYETLGPKMAKLDFKDEYLMSGFNSVAEFEEVINKKNEVKSNYMQLFDCFRGTPC
jgi:hypothetical protein